MDIRRRRLSVIILLTLVVVLMAVLLWSPNQLFELKVNGIEPSGMRDVYGEALLVTLSISNRSSLGVSFEDGHKLEVRINGHWIEVATVYRFGQAAAGRTTDDLVVLPAGTEACRLHLNYRPPGWRFRLMAILGPTGRTLLAKSPLWVRKWLWPDPQILMNKPPPSWRRTTLQVTVTQSFARPAPLRTQSQR